MAKTVLVECYEADGGSYSFRMTPEEWDDAVPMLSSMLGTQLGGPTFYMAYTNLKRRWDGAKKRTLHSVLCLPGFDVVWKKVEGGCHCNMVPVLVPSE